MTPESQDYQPRSLGAEQATNLGEYVRNKIIPMKFMYSGLGARIQLSLPIDSPDHYGGGRIAAEIEMITTALSESKADGIRDFGVSNGYHTECLLTGLRDRSISPRSYVGVEFGAELLASAKQRLVTQPIPSKRYLNIDIEDEIPIRDFGLADDTPHVNLLLGGIVGNVEDPEATLSNIRSMCGRGDQAVIGLYALEQAHEGRNEEFYRQPLVAQNICSPLLDCGISSDAFRFDVGTDGGGDIVGHANILRPVPRFGLQEGDSIRIFLSRRYTIDRALRTLNSGGWRPVQSRLARGHLFFRCALAD